MASATAGERPWTNSADTNLLARPNLQPQQLTPKRLRQIVDAVPTPMVPCRRQEAHAFDISLYVSRVWSGSSASSPAPAQAAEIRSHAGLRLDHTRIGPTQLRSDARAWVPGEAGDVHFVNHAGGERSLQWNVTLSNHIWRCRPHAFHAQREASARLAGDRLFKQAEFSVSVIAWAGRDDTRV
jgi:hypothetical protein